MFGICCTCSIDYIISDFQAASTLTTSHCIAYHTFRFVYPYFRVCIYIHIVRLQLYSSRNGNWDFINYVQGVYPSRKTRN